METQSKLEALARDLSSVYVRDCASLDAPPTKRDIWEQLSQTSRDEWMLKALDVVNQQDLIMGAKAEINPFKINPNAKPIVIRMPPIERGKDFLLKEAGMIFVDKSAVDDAIDLLCRFDPESHRLADYVLAIAAAVTGQKYGIDDKSGATAIAQDSGRAGVFEIEITPAMIEAGASFLRLASVGGEPCDGREADALGAFCATLQASSAFQSGALRLQLDGLIL